MLEIYQDSSRIMSLLNERSIRRTFCSCEIVKFAKNSGRSLNKEDLINLFMGTWIDQTIYWILKDSRNADRLHESEFYQEFYEKFNFAKFELHGWNNLVSPIFFLIGIKRFNLMQEKELILFTKIKYWDLGVKEYLLSKDRKDIVELAEEEFNRDLSLRHRFTENQERELRYLLKTTYNNYD